VFANASLAARVDRAESSTIAELAEAAAARLGPDRVFVARIGGGVAVHAGPGSPINKFAGLGFAPPPTVEELEAVEAEFARRGSPLQVELASLGDPEMARTLTGRGYRPIGFENVLGLRLDPPSPEAEGAAIQVTRAGPHEDRAWMDAVATGFLHPDTYDGPPAHESHAREAIDTAPGSKSAENVQRFGFAILYVRAVLVKPPIP
jgi:hypothetical protein